MSTCARAAVDGPFTPGRRSGCQVESSTPPADTYGPPNPRRTIDTQYTCQDGRRRENYIPGDGAARVHRTRCHRLLSVLGAYWPVPAAAVAFLLAMIGLGYSTWGQALPGAQAVFLMSLLQCCWAVMSSQGHRRILRLTQLTATLLGVLMLLPRVDIYGTRIWASSFDDEGGVILPGFAASLATLFGLMGTSAEGKVEQLGYGVAEDAHFNRALLSLEVSLAIVVLLWLLQAAAAGYALSSAPTAGGLAGLAPSMQSALKSHLDLSALESLDVRTPMCDPKLRPDMRPVSALDVGYDAAHDPCLMASGFGPLSPRRPGHLDGELQQQLCRASLAACTGQRVLLSGACLAQCVAAAVIVDTWDAFAQRLQLEDGAPSGASTSERTDAAQAPLLIDSMRASWVALGLLAAAMSATLTLPALLRSRHLLHTALLVRPAATRSLGLLLLDLNAAKLLLSVSVGVLGGWRAGALTWQLLQVCTMTLGVAKLYVGGLKAQLANVAVATVVVPSSGLGAAEAPGRLLLVVPVVVGLCEDASAAPNSLGECASALAASPLFADAVGRAAGTAQDRSPGFRVAPEVSSAALAPVSCGDVACATTASTATTGGRSSTCSSNTLRSPYSSGNSLASAADVEPHQTCSGCGAGASPLSTTPSSQLARRPPPLVLAGHVPQCNHHPQQSPLLPPSATGPGGTPRLLPTVMRSACSACARGCGLAAVAVRPWSLLLGSLSLLGGMLWMVLMAPPLAVLGEEPVDFFEGLVDTGPGAEVVLTLVVGIAAAFTVSGTTLLWCIANGELRQRWRLNPIEKRRLECLAWACGPPLAVAAFSALSWALGDEHNAVPYVAAEVLRCASLWPLVWLLEPWLIGGVHCVGGCAQHAGCGVTCCVLRWCGLRPNGLGALGERCDERGREAGLQLARAVSRRGRGASLQAEVV